MIIVIISNKACKLIDNENINRIIILIIHLILIAGMLIFLRKILNNYIKNINILNGILPLLGPIIGATSNYIVPIIKDITKII
jgi:hypothetical protein